MIEQENIDKLAKNLLSDFEMDVPTYIWPEIELQLKGTKRKRGLVWWTSIAAGLLVLLSFFSGYWLSNRIKSHSKQTDYVSVQSSKIKDEETKLTIDPLPDRRVAIPTVANHTQEHHNKDITRKYKQHHSQIFDLKEIGKNDSILKQEIKTGHASQEMVQVEPVGEKHDYISPRVAVLMVKKASVELVYPERLFFYVPSTEQTHRIYIGAQYAPMVAGSAGSGSKNTLLASQNAVVTANSVLSSSSQSSVQTFAYNCGIPCEFELTKRFSIQSGLFLNMCQQSTINISGATFASSNPSYDNLLNVVNLGSEQPQMAYINNTTIQQGVTSSNANLNQNFYYIEIPMSLKYKIIDRKIGLFVQTGIISGFLTKNNAELEDQTGKIWTGKTEQMNAIVYHSTVSLGLQFSPSPRISIVALPSFRYCINGYSSNNNVYNFPISFGVYTGVNIKL